MNISLFVLFSVVTVLLIHDSDAWRRRRFRFRFRFRSRRNFVVRPPPPPPPPPCVGSDICAGSCLNGKCTWHCGNTCDVMVNGELSKSKWPGTVVSLPCKFSEYDYTGIGYFIPADLAWHMNERGSESDNMMVFRKLDQNGDGKVSAQEFKNTKNIIDIATETC